MADSALGAIGRGLYDMMKMVGLLATAATMAMAGPVSAATVTFEPLAGQSSFGTPAVLTEAGYTLNYAPTGGGGFFIVGAPPTCTPACASDGTNAFYSFNSGSLTITATNGGLFSLSSFVAATTFTTINRSLSLMVTGQSTGGPVTTTFTRAAGAADTFTTFTTSAFTNLTAVTFTAAVGASSSEFALDNIVLNAVSVPEPASWAMMILGMGVVGFAMRRRTGVTTRISYAG